MGIKKLIISWLGLDKLERECVRLDSRCKELERIYKSVDVAVDIHPFGKKSWAVLCFDGHPEYIKFVDLSNEDIRTIAKFLKQFDPGRIIIDRPPQVPRELFY